MCCCDLNWKFQFSSFRQLRGSCSSSKFAWSKVRNLLELCTRKPTTHPSHVCFSSGLPPRPPTTASSDQRLSFPVSWLATTCFEKSTTSISSSSTQPVSIDFPHHVARTFRSLLQARLAIQLASLTIFWKKNVFKCLWGRTVWIVFFGCIKICLMRWKKEGYHLMLAFMIISEETKVFQMRSFRKGSSPNVSPSKEFCASKTRACASTVKILVWFLWIVVYSFLLDHYEVSLVDE